MIYGRINSRDWDPLTDVDSLMEATLHAFYIISFTKGGLAIDKYLNSL